MKYRDEQGNIKELRVKAQDNLPIGSIVDYDGEEVPEGYIEVEDENNIYDGEERVIGTWFGKPLYSKTIFFQNVQLGSVNHNIPNIEKIWIDLSKTYWISQDETFTAPFFYTGINTGNEQQMVNNYMSLARAVTKTEIQFNMGNIPVFNNIYITLNYTKTTD